MPRKSPYVLDLTAEQRQALEDRARRYTLPYREVVRAKIVLMAAAGLDNDEIAARLDRGQAMIGAKSATGSGAAGEGTKFAAFDLSRQGEHVSALQLNVLPGERRDPSEILVGHRSAPVREF